MTYLILTFKCHIPWQGQGQYHARHMLNILI